MAQDSHWQVAEKVPFPGYCEERQRRSNLYVFDILTPRLLRRVYPEEVELPYAKMGLFGMGIRDFRPKALQFLIASNIVGETDAGRYYIKDKKVSLRKSE